MRLPSPTWLHPRSLLQVGLQQYLRIDQITPFCHWPVCFATECIHNSEDVKVKLNREFQTRLFWADLINFFFHQKVTFAPGLVEQQLWYFQLSFVLHWSTGNRAPLLSFRMLYLVTFAPHMGASATFALCSRRFRSPFEFHSRCFPALLLQ